MPVSERKIAIAFGKDQSRGRACPAQSRSVAAALLIVGGVASLYNTPALFLSLVKFGGCRRKVHAIGVDEAGIMQHSRCF